MIKSAPIYCRFWVFYTGVATVSILTDALYDINAYDLPQLITPIEATGSFYLLKYDVDAVSELALFATVDDVKRS